MFTETNLVPFEEVILGVEPSCESRYHGTGHPFSCNHDGPAAWLQLGNCSHTTGLRCDRYVRHIRERITRDQYVSWTCGLCKIWFEPGRFIPID